jgi:trans-aconitate 2-methyltransferase
MSKDWNPEQYLKFNRERIQPSIDLVSRIYFNKPESIIDIGCGPGNSTQILVSRWPGARIIGVDNSPAMIAKAKMDYPAQDWLLADAGKDQIEGNFDIVFSNATIQWIPDHAGLIKKLFRLLTDNGLLAVQIPMFWDMPVGKGLLKISGESPYKQPTQGVKELFTIHDYSFYFDQLSELSESIDIWETSYFHIMESHFSILEMIRSTGLKPYLDKLQKSDKNTFEKLVLEEIKKDYKVQTNGKVLFPFKRLFFIAKK